MVVQYLKASQEKSWSVGKTPQSHVLNHNQQLHAEHGRSCNLNPLTAVLRHRGGWADTTTADKNLYLMLTEEISLETFMPWTYTTAKVSVIGFTYLIFLVVTLLFGRACEWSAWTPRQLGGWMGISLPLLNNIHQGSLEKRSEPSAQCPSSRELWLPWAAPRPKCVWIWSRVLKWMSIGSANIFKDYRVAYVFVI